MGRTSSADLDRALKHPGRVYRSPEEVANDDNLSQNRKVAVLKNWAGQVQESLLRESGGSGEGSSGEEEFLSRIMHTIHVLQRSTR